MRLLAALFVLMVSPAFAESEIHIVHCLKGCPTGAPDSNDLIVREIYALSSNDTTKFADWAAYKVTRQTIGTTTNLVRSWKSDPYLEDEETLEKPDYDGANDAHGYERGHLVPMASFAGTHFWRDTNFLSNITPQKEDLNGESWKYLEGAVRKLVWLKGNTWVVTGPLYESDADKLPEANETHTVPSGFWKVISDSKGNITAFIFDQDIAANAKYCDQIVPLSDVESRSGLDLFPKAPASWPRGSLKAGLGC